MTTIDKIRADIIRRITDNTFGAKLELMDILSFLDTLEEPVGKTCKTCGFYENNCPFIRGKFISYPNKVCKDYTFSTLKAEQEPVSENLEEELERRYEQAKWGYVDGFGETVMDKEQFTRIARHFAQWGAEHLHDSTKMTSDDLEEEAEEWAENEAYGKPDAEFEMAYKGFKAGAEWKKAKMIERATYNELMELYRAIRDELVKRHRDVPVNIKEEQ